MAGIVSEMLDESLQALKARDAGRSAEVWKRDDEVDDLYHGILSSMQQEMQDNPANIPSCTHVVFAAKNFERIADYATSIARMVYYIASGESASKAAMRAALPNAG